MFGREYEVPYNNLVPNDPSFEEMYGVVCVKQLRPPLDHQVPTVVPPEHDQLLKSIRNLITECWSQKPASRLTTLRVKKTIADLVETATML